MPTDDAPRAPHSWGRAAGAITGATPAGATPGASTPSETPAGASTARPRYHGRALVLVLALLAAGLAASLLVGARMLDPTTAVAALLGRMPTSSPEAVIMANRLTRTVVGLVVGACLAVAGAATQGVTRNPLGDPGVLGINAGAAFAVVLATASFGVTGMSRLALWAFVGSGVAVVVVYAVASFGRDGATPLKLALVGAALSAGLGSLSSALIVGSQSTLDQLRRWQVGGLTRSSLHDVATVSPLALVGLALTVGFAASMNNFALGDDMARSLGERVALKRALIAVGVALLCGVAVALAGPIAFLGLMVPHLLRGLVGPDYRWLLPLSLLLGPAVVLLADAVGRVVLPPTEIEVGVSMALVGVPVFLWLIRARSAVNL